MKWFYCFSFVCLISTAAAQELSPVVMSTSGNDIRTTDGYHFSSTLGESFVTTLENGGYILTQGFHQTFFDTVSEETTNFHVFNAFSPDGDQVNDIWIIDSIQHYPDNSVILFNRWGNVINSFEGYDNDQVVWDGKNKDGGEIPGGTYFYVIKAGDRKESGWVQVVK